MLLGGLWHGAAWNFVIWGALHGIALTVTRIWQRWSKRHELSWNTRWWYKALAVFATFHYVCLTWIFFRAQTTEQALAIIGRLGDLSFGWANLVPSVMLALGAGYAIHASPTAWRERATKLYAKAPAPLQALALTIVIFALREVATSAVVPFIYFQF